MMTTVISVRGRNREELLADPNFVYVARRVPRTKWRDSIWGNPFRARKHNVLRIDFTKVDITWFKHATIDTRRTAFDHAVDLYRQWIEVNETLRSQLPALRGKTLGCWCACWEPGQPIVTPCHGIVICEMANALQEIR